MASFISDLQISQLDVLEALNSLDVTKSTGPDGIGPKLLKQCTLALYIPIYHLFCISISKQAIPSEWKCHSITPVYKSGDKALVNNYRPISLLCIISKVLERFVFDYLNKFLNENIVLSRHQFGFRQNHSVTYQLLLFLSNVHESLNHYSSCDVIYRDFKKALDTVPHNELLLKLWKTGITWNTWRWLQKYLTGRRQHVNINGCFSSALPVISGVPQGSILGPLLFLIYINDLPSCTTYVNLFLFADDTKCLKSITTPVDTTLLQSDLDSLSEWSLEWKLSFNELKCFLLTFLTKNNQTRSCNSHSAALYSGQHPEYFVNNSPISACTSQKDLGILMTSNLSWSEHIALITYKAYKKLGLLRRTFCSRNTSCAKRSLYLSRLI